jgi:6-phosphofructokinase 1
MLTIVRESDEPYRCTIGQAPLAAVAHGVRRLPDEYIAPEGNFVTPAFLTYARPLIGGPLPEYARLQGVPVGLATARARNEG